MAPAAAGAQRLITEMLWVLLLFPSSPETAAKRQQIRELWALGGVGLPESHPLLNDEVLKGFTQPGASYNTCRPHTFEQLISLTRDLKSRTFGERKQILASFDDEFFAWIDSVSVSLPGPRPLSFVIGIGLCL
jgi:5-methylcytosine-specific restriction protein B